MRPFHSFVKEVRDAVLGVSLPESLLRNVYKLARKRHRYPQLEEEEKKRAAELRRMVSVVGKLRRDGNHLAKRALALEAAIQTEGLKSPSLMKSTERVNAAISQLLEDLESARQSQIELIFPSLTRKHKQRLVTFRLWYDLERLGPSAADTAFLWEAHTLLDKFWKAHGSAVRKHHWEILRTFKLALFAEREVMSRKNFRSNTLPLRANLLPSNPL